jgi:hypothetical protein
VDTLSTLPDVPPGDGADRGLEPPRGPVEGDEPDAPAFAVVEAGAPDAPPSAVVEAGAPEAPAPAVVEAGVPDAPAPAVVVEAGVPEAPALAVVEGDAPAAPATAVADGDVSVVEEQPAESPFTADASATAAIHALSLFDGDRRALRRRRVTLRLVGS